MAIHAFADVGADSPELWCLHRSFMAHFPNSSIIKTNASAMNPVSGSAAILWDIAEAFVLMMLEFGKELALVMSFSATVHYRH